MPELNHKSQNFYFPNLNGLRAIGAFIVLLGHIAFIKELWGLPYSSWFPIPGKIGVTLFFALSGFLITSLLLRELQITHTIKLKKFYIRRILRIWPLYYLLIILGLLVFNRIGLLKVPFYSNMAYDHLTITNVLILIFILPNFTGYYIPYTDQRWSIVVEEQFYLIQPLLIRVLKKRKLLIGIFLIILISPEIFYLLINSFKLQQLISAQVISSIHLQLKYFGCIVMGCLFSFLFFEKETPLKKILYSKAIQYITMIILIICVVLGTYLFHTEELIDYRLYAFLFSIVVLNASQNDRTIFRLETFTLNFLGKISYGIYMYHQICIGISLAIISFITHNIVLSNMILYPLSILLSVFVSWLSYNYFESIFLKLKSKFQSGILRKKQPEMSVSAFPALSE